MRIITTYRKDDTGVIIVTTRYEGTDEELHQVELQCLRNIGTGTIKSTEALYDSSADHPKADEKKKGQ